MFVEAGRELGLRMREEGGVNDGARLAYGYRLATSRSPERAEELKTAHDRLVGTDAMGALFKVMAITPRHGVRGAGFG